MGDRNRELRVHAQDLLYDGAGHAQAALPDMVVDQFEPRQDEIGVGLPRLLPERDRLVAATRLAQEILRVNPNLTAESATELALAMGFDRDEARENLRRAGLPDHVEAPPDAAALHASGRPGIAVLPFCNLSGDPEQAYFADGVTEDLTAVLSRSPDRGSRV